MLVPSPSSKRSLRDQKLLLQLRQPSSVFFFYPVHQLSAKVLQQLSLRYLGKGFCWYLFGRRWHPSFWPQNHAAYHFLSRGNFYGLHWPNWSLWQEAQAALPLPSFGLYQGHFFLESQAPTQAPLLAPAALCGSLHAAWIPLVHCLSYLAVQLTFLLQKQP